MIQDSGVFTANYQAPPGAETVEYWFNSSINGSPVWDSNNSANYSFPAGNSFAIDGKLDSPDYEVASHDWMKLWAAVRGDKLYVSTWGTGDDSYDHFIFFATNLGDATDAASAWNKDGLVFLDNHVYLAGEGESSYAGWSTSTGAPTAANAKDDGKPENYLEGVIDLKALNGGQMPEAIYIAVGAFDSWNSGQLKVQAPAPWDANQHLEVTEFIRLPIASIRDENVDGHFDVGRPRMWTVVDENQQDANYGLRRFFLDETRSEQEWLTVVLEPRTGRDDQIAEIEVFSNLNRRDYAKLPGDEDPDTVTSTSLDTYYLGYPMASVGGGLYRVTLPVRVRRLPHQRPLALQRRRTWHYYTDNGLRRDSAVVVSPKKALDTTLYELNPLTAEATSDEFTGRSTFRNMFQPDAGRPGAISPDNLQNLGVNMIWLQPIHPIGTIGREIDPLTQQIYDPGSPYAVKNYWQVNQVLGDDNTADSAMKEFSSLSRPTATTASASCSTARSTTRRGTRKSASWRSNSACRLPGRGGQPDGPHLRGPSGLVFEQRQLRIARHLFRQHATTPTSPSRPTASISASGAMRPISSSATTMPGSGPAASRLNRKSIAGSALGINRFLREDDDFERFTRRPRNSGNTSPPTRSTGWRKPAIPRTRRKIQSDKGIDGLRCDFAQGLPNLFWEYAINKTRTVKWDFLFMAESLDGYREVDGSKRHGVGYRSARHFDILNENILYLWRDDFFDYRTYADQTSSVPNRTTGLIWNAFDARKNAFELSPVLLNLISHDEIFPDRRPMVAGSMPMPSTRPWTACR